MQVNTPDLTLIAARTERDALAGRTDVLDKVGVLRTLPDNMHVTTDMVAEYYEVDRETILTVVKRNRDEVDDDGYRVVTKSVFEETFKLNVSSSANRVALFPRRVVLRVGMLLRDSDIAKRVRTYLLDVEQASRDLSEDEIVLRAMQIQTRKVELLTAKVAELTPKADLADTYLIAEGGARLVREAAKLLGMKEKDLRRFLLDEKLIFAKHAPCGVIQYDHYAQYDHHFKATEHIVNHTHGTCTHYTLHILPRGIELARKRLNETRQARNGQAIAS